MKNRSYPISVVMSVYNGEKYLHEALESILNQIFKDFEFIIIDDGSTDNSVEIIKSYKDSRIKLIQQENRGLAAALNRGIRIARGKYIARMDADDISHPDRLRQQVEFMENHPECLALGTQAYVMREDGEKIYVSKVPLDDKTLKSGLPDKCPFFHGSVMFRRNDAINCGGYPEKIYHYIEDIVLWNRISKRGEIRNLSSALYFWRIVPESVSVYSRNTSHKLKRLIKKFAESDIDERDKKFINSLREKWKHINKEAYYFSKVGKCYLERTDDLKNARRFLFKVVCKAPLMWNAWFNLLLCLLPRDRVKEWKKKRIGNL